MAAAFFVTLLPLMLLPGLPARSSSPPRVRSSLRLSERASEGGTQLVWLTGHGDLRLADHGGFSAASSSVKGAVAVVPLFVIDPQVHLRYPPARLMCLHTALTSLDRELREVYDSELVVRTGPAAEVLCATAEECSAATCHVVRDDVEFGMREAQRASCAALESMGVDVRRWDGMLRDKTGDSTEEAGFFPDYAAAAAGQPLRAPLGAPARDQIRSLDEPLRGDGVPTLASLLQMAEQASPSSVKATAGFEDTTPPYLELAAELCDAPAARAALRHYVALGRDQFADARLSCATGRRQSLAGGSSLHTAGAQRLLDGSSRPSLALSLREAPTRAFSAALGVGALSVREARAAATEAGATAAASLGEMPFWGRSSGDALADVCEWREWFERLAQRSLARQEAGLPATSGGEVAASGDARAPGTVRHWRWNGVHLVRYLSWDAGAAFDGTAPALLLTHGFAASCEQWERLVHALQERAPAGSLPPIFAIDLVGFGHSDKPDLSYTQYLWEAQIIDFAREVMGGRDLVLVGNSIGGGLSAGAAAGLGSACKGVVLCNTAGELKEPDEYQRDYVDAGRVVRDATIDGSSAKPYSPIPLLGPPALEAFGAGIINLIYPQIGTRLTDIYTDRPQNADESLAYAIQQGAKSPGSPNVIGSGQKLAENRPLNEVLSADHGFGGPVLVCQGVNDRVSGAKRAQERADSLARMRDGVTVRKIVGGHCVQDDAPTEVAEALLAWLPRAARASLE
jgi:pimeloyl-ACP methyl ester carboxylesterase